MPKLAKDYELENNRYYQAYMNSSISRKVVAESTNVSNVQPIYQKRRIVADQKKIRRNNLIHRILAVTIVSVLGLTVLPIGFNKVTKSFWRTSQYPYIKADYEQIVNPTIDYISNDWYLRKRLLTEVNLKKRLMTQINQSQGL